MRKKMTVKVEDYFKVYYGVNLELVHLKEDPNGINFVSRTSQNNGISAKVKILPNLNPNPKNTLSVSCGGSVMETFLQEKEYYSGRDIYILEPKIKLTKKQLLYYCLCLKNNKYRFNYGRQANKTLKLIEIPPLNGIPNWVGKIKIPKIPSKKPVLNKKNNLGNVKWEYFQLNSIFNIKGTKTTSLTKLEEKGKGKFPYVTTQATNNGVGNHFNYYTEEGNVITVDSAVIGFASYQDKKFSASDHVEKLIPLFEMNKYNALFIVTLLNKERDRWNYGRKSSQTRLLNLKIKLPINEEDYPDWKFMEEYIKSVSYSISI